MFLKPKKPNRFANCIASTSFENTAISWSVCSRRGSWSCLFLWD